MGSLEVPVETMFQAVFQHWLQQHRGCRHVSGRLSALWAWKKLEPMANPFELLDDAHYVRTGARALCEPERAWDLRRTTGSDKRLLLRCRKSSKLPPAWACDDARGCPSWQ